MPRSKPTQVIEIRHSLSTWERDRIKRAELVAATAVILPAAGIALAGVGSGLAGYALYQWLKDGLFTELGDSWEDLKQDYANRPEVVVYGEGFWSMLWGSIIGYKGPFEPLPPKG